MQMHIIKTTIDTYYVNGVQHMSLESIPDAQPFVCPRGHNVRGGVGE